MPSVIYELNIFELIMNLSNLLSKGYFPKELPPCFNTELFASNYSRIVADEAINENVALVTFQNSANKIPGLSKKQIEEEKIRRKQIFKNRLAFSEPVNYSIPKPGLARNIVKVVNPIHQGRLSDAIFANYAAINLLFKDSIISTTKPQIEHETGEEKRSVKHENYGYFKEISIINSYKYAFQLKTDISKFYPSIYTHSIPWITFGGKELYKKNRNLNKNDPSKVANIYGDSIDDRLMWCQNQQTMGIPIGPDTSFIVAEIVGCHLDKLLTHNLTKRKIDFLAYRYYDDYLLYFNNELDAQIGLTELKNILSDFELKINDNKTLISKTQSELEKDWALAIKSFYFRPSKKDQREDIWNYFSIAFKFASIYSNENVLKLALNKFNYVRIEKENWDFFESLIFRLGLVETSGLQKIAKLLVTYKDIVNKMKLKIFCLEIISRHYQNGHDYELTWALWILKEFDLQPTKEFFDKILKSKCVCASIIALDLLANNKRIKNFDYSEVQSLISTENLNSKYWMLVYESLFNKWNIGLPISVITDHFYFNIVLSYNVNFYNNSRNLEPLTVENTYFVKIERKISQLVSYIKRNKLQDEDIKNQILELSQNLNISASQEKLDRSEIRKRLTDSDQIIHELLIITEDIKSKLQKFEKKKLYFVIGKRLEELGELTALEITSESEQEKNLLFDPTYE